MTAHSIPRRLAWYARRLSSMSAGEVVHRFAELSKKQSARLAPSGWARYATPDGPLPIFPARIDVSAADDDMIARWQQVADDAIARRHRFLGVDWPDNGATSIWHFDPVSARQWPKDAYCFAINYRHHDLYGDVKYVWEINRLQYLQPVAALAARTGRADLKTFVAREISDWIAENPPFLGINWPSGIELSLRAISVLVATRLLGPEAFSQEKGRAIRAFLAATGDWLSRYPSRFSSANNHLVAEAVGLLVIGAACPDLPAAAAWQAYGRRVLEEEASRQFHADGIGAEQSPTYTAFTLELYMAAVHVAESQGKPLPRTVLDALAAAGEALSWFMDENGAVPRIGDDDEGRVIVSDPEADRLYVASVLSALAATCERPDIAPPAAPPHLRNLVFGRLLAQPRGRGVRTFAEGGYTVLRDAVGHRALMLCMDHGPLGFLSIAAHGHADTLALWLTYDGKPLLADAGTYLYHSGGAWRDAFRGTGLHNTLAIAGESSSLVSGAFNWKAKAGVSGVAVTDDPETFHCRATHDGYLARFGVKHTRSLQRSGTDTFIVADMLEAGDAQARDVTIAFLAGDGVEIRKADGRAVFDFMVDGKPMMRLSGPQALSARVACGEAEEKLGWRSPCFGQKQPAHQLIFSGSVRPGENMLTKLRLL